MNPYIADPTTTLQIAAARRAEDIERTARWRMTRLARAELHRAPTAGLGRDEARRPTARPVHGPAVARTPWTTLLRRALTFTG